MKCVIIRIFPRVVLIGIATGSLLGASAVGVQFWSLPKQLLAVTRLAPATTIGGEIESRPTAPVEFRYQLRNQTSRTLRELTPVLGCGCELVGPFPSQLGPGETSTLAFRIRAPYVGQSAFRFPVTAEGYSQPIAAIEGTIRAVGQVPRVIAGSGYATVALIKGAGATTAAQIRTLEYRSSPPWGASARLESNTGISASLRMTGERREADPEICERTYEIALDGGELPSGDYRGDLVVISSAGEELRRISLALHVVPRLGVFPVRSVEAGEVDHPTQPQTLTVVDRLRGGPVRVAEFDASTLKVSQRDLPVGSVFEIAPVEGADAESAMITFSTDDGVRERVVIALH